MTSRLCRSARNRTGLGRGDALWAGLLCLTTCAYKWAFPNSRLGGLEKSIAFFAKGIGKNITKCVPYSCTLERLGVNEAAIRKQESGRGGVAGQRHGGLWIEMAALASILEHIFDTLNELHDNAGIRYCRGSTSACCSWGTSRNSIRDAGFAWRCADSLGRLRSGCGYQR